MISVKNIFIFESYISPIINQNPMKTKLQLAFVSMVLAATTSFAQQPDPMVQEIVTEATENSQLKKLGHELLDVIGPRLVGSPQMEQAHDWAAKSNKCQDCEIAKTKRKFCHLGKCWISING